MRLTNSVLETVITETSGEEVIPLVIKLKEVRTVYGKLMKEKIEKLNDRLKRESNNNFYSCKNKCMRVSFESAVDFDFKCQECAELLELENNTETIKNIHAQLKEIEKFLKMEKF